MVVGREDGIWFGDLLQGLDFKLKSLSPVTEETQMSPQEQPLQHLSYKLSWQPKRAAE